MAIEIVSVGWCCAPCLFRMEFGTVPADWSADEITDWLAHIENNTRDAGAVGAIAQHPIPGACEYARSSSSPCDYCGDRTAGERNAFTWQPAELASV